MLEGLEMAPEGRGQVRESAPRGAQGGELPGSWSGAERRQERQAGDAPTTPEPRILRVGTRARLWLAVGAGGVLLGLVIALALSSRPPIEGSAAFPGPSSPPAEGPQAAAEAPPAARRALEAVLPAPVAASVAAPPGLPAEGPHEAARASDRGEPTRPVPSALPLTMHPWNRPVSVHSWDWRPPEPLSRHPTSAARAPASVVAGEETPPPVITQDAAANGVQNVFLTEKLRPE
jgi:hypothetical protein